MRKNISSGSPWEPKVGFSRAVRSGSQFFFSGTLDTDENGMPVGKDAYGQTVNILRKLEDALAEAGGDLSDVVRTRMYIVSKNDSDPVSRAHAEFFADIRPAATMIVVAGLLGEGFLVEIEADAVIG